MKNQNLILDFGNTAIKWGLFIENQLESFHSFYIDDLKENQAQIIELASKSSHCFISGSGNTEFDFIAEIVENTSTLFFTPETKLPFKLNYSTPETLGLDRKANVAAALTKFPDKNSLIVDAGTCVTYDLLTSDAVYHGGAISPGLSMRFNAMHTFTEKLPLLSQKIEHDVKQFIGNSTSSSIQVGAINGLVYEIEGFINSYKQNYRDLTLILTGGDTHYLSSRLKSSIFADLNFQLRGLNSILEYNKANA